MSANKAKFLIEIDGFQPSDFTVTRFDGYDAVSAPYNFEIDFQLSESSQLSSKQQVAITADKILGRYCRFTLIRSHKGEESVYSGVVKKFRTKQCSNPVYTICLVPWLYLLSLNVNNRVFQKLPVVDIVKKVIAGTGIEDHCEFRYDCKTNYPEITFCVQHNETDLNFISRLMERNGIWYYFENMGGEMKKDRVVITDHFSGFSGRKIEIPFRERGDSENFGESVFLLESNAELIPKCVRLRTQNYRTPENKPEGKHDLDGNDACAWGNVDEYGGSFKDSEEATRLAKLYMRRLQVENMRTEGQGYCNAFRAGLLISVSNAGNQPNGDFLITSVTHQGGANQKGDYTYKNIFVCIDSRTKTYAPPLRAISPHVDGLITAPIDAMGEEHPSLDDKGNYRVRLPFDDSKTEAYGATKDIRLAQPSGGYSDGRSYGMHFPSKIGAEMVLAYVDGDPDRPIGLGFVPNASAVSPVNNKNRDLNVMRTWGDNVLIMDDTPKKQKIVLATADNGHLHNGDHGVDPDAKTSNNELLFDNEHKMARIRAFLHNIVLCYNEKENSITIMTEAQNRIELDDKGQKITVQTKTGNVVALNDPDDLITIQNSGENGNNKVVLDGKGKNITLDSMDNTVVINGGEKRITLESENSKVAIDGKGKKIVMENKDNKVIIDSGDNSVTLEAKKNITLKAGGKVVIDAADGISNKGNAFDVAN